MKYYKPFKETEKYLNEKAKIKPVVVDADTCGLPVRLRVIHYKKVLLKFLLNNKKRRNMYISNTVIEFLKDPNYTVDPYTLSFSNYYKLNIKIQNDLITFINRNNTSYENKGDKGEFFEIKYICDTEENKTLENQFDKCKIMLAYDK